MVTLVPPEELLQGFDTTGMPSLEAHLKRTRNTLNFNSEAEYGKGKHIGLVLNLLDRYYRDDAVRTAVNATFQNQVVVDLGAGKYPFGYWMAQLGGARAYIGNEPFFTFDLTSQLLTPQKLDDETEELPHVKRFREEPHNNIPVAVTGEDMLSLLDRLPERSVSILISGIDGAILPSTYGYDLGDALPAPLHPDGGLIAFDVLDVFLGEELESVQRFPNEHGYDRLVSGRFKSL